MQDFNSIRVAIVISASMVNTETHRYANRQLRPAMLLARYQLN